MDIFGYPVNLSFDKKGGGASNSIFFPQPTHQTNCGGCFSIIFALLLIMVIYGLVQNDSDFILLEESTTNLTSYQRIGIFGGFI